MAAWRAGAWFIGVVGDHAPAAYQITFQRFACPFNCSGHGECVDSSSPRACRCDDGFSGRDCSKDVRPVAWGEAVTSEPAKFDELFFTLPNATGGMQHGEAGMVVVNASYFGMPSHHLDAHPSILLARVRGLVTACDRVPLRAMCVWQPSTCQQSAHSFHPRSPPPPPPPPRAAAAQSGDGQRFPSPEDFDRQLVLDKQNVTRTLTLCASEWAAGVWQLAVYNPLAGNAIAFTLTVSKHASCLRGSQRGVPRPDDKGVCWQECICDSESQECRCAQRSRGAGGACHSHPPTRPVALAHARAVLEKHVRISGATLDSGARRAPRMCAFRTSASGCAGGALSAGQACPARAPPTRPPARPPMPAGRVGGDAPVRVPARLRVPRGRQPVRAV